MKREPPYEARRKGRATKGQTPGAGERVPKTTRITMRVDPDVKATISLAAQARHTSLSDYVLEKAHEAAQRELAAQNQILLNKQQWKAFCTALDAPPREIPVLRQLLANPSVLD